MAVQCLNNKAGIGDRCKKKNNFAPIAGYFLATSDQSFATATDMADVTKWDEDIRDKKLLPLHDIEAVEPQPVEDGVFTGATGRKVKQYNGINGAKYSFLLDLESHKILKTWTGGNFRIYKYDMNNNIKGISVDGTIVKGIKLSYFEVSNQDEPAGADTPAFTHVEIQEADANEWNDFGVYLENPNFIIGDRVGVNTVILTQVTAVAGNAWVCSVAYVDDSRYDGQALGVDTSNVITGLVAANFSGFKAADGTALDAVTAAEDGDIPGQYTVGATLLVATDTVKVDPSTANQHESDLVTIS